MRKPTLKWTRTSTNTDYLPFLLCSGPFRGEVQRAQREELTMARRVPEWKRGAASDPQHSYALYHFDSQNGDQWGMLGPAHALASGCGGCRHVGGKKMAAER